MHLRFGIEFENSVCHERAYPFSSVDFSLRFEMEIKRNVVSLHPRYFLFSLGVSILLISGFPSRSAPIIAREINERSQ